MGIRPHMALVFGVDDFDYSKVNFDWEELGVTSYKPTEAEIEQDGWLAFLSDRPEDSILDVLYLSLDGNRIIGLRIDQSYYDDCLLRALSVMFPQLAESGKWDVPTLQVDKHPLRMRKLESALKSGPPSIEWQPQWFYPAVIEMQSLWPIYAHNLCWLLSKIGIEIDYHRFKAMVVWDWC